MARPRSARAHNDVLDAAESLFAERGIDATTMDAIAGESGVSKATIYKHWRDKDEVLLEVLARLHRRESLPPDPDSGSLRDDLIAVLGYRPAAPGGRRQARLMPQLMAYASSRPAFARAWQARAVEPPRQQLVRLLERGVAAGQLRRDLDLDLAVALLAGPMLYRNLLVLVRGRQPERLTEGVVDAFLASCGRPRPDGRRRRSPARRSRSPGRETAG